MHTPQKLRAHTHTHTHTCMHTSCTHTRACTQAAHTCMHTSKHPNTGFTHRSHNTHTVTHPLPGQGQHPSSPHILHTPRSSLHTPNPTLLLPLAHAAGFKFQKDQNKYNSTPRHKLLILMEADMATDQRIKEMVGCVRSHLQQQLDVAMKSMHDGGLHITIQNKVTPQEARALQAELAPLLPAREFAFTGLGLHIYRGPHWEHVGSFAFRGKERG